MRGNERNVVSWIKLRMWAVVMGLPALAAVGTPSAPNYYKDWSVNKTEKAVGGTDLEDQVGEQQRSGW